MAQAYFIGGAPRVGKTTLAQAFLKLSPMPAAATDDLRAVQRAATSPDNAPDLFYLDSLNADQADMTRRMLYDTTDIIAAADRESAAVWPAIETRVKTELEAGNDILVEGVAVLPDMLSTLDLPFTAVFLGNQSPAHSQVIQEYAANHPDTWLGSLQPATVTAFSIFCQATSTHIQQQATHFGFNYIEIGTESFAEDLNKALSALKPGQS